MASQRENLGEVGGDRFETSKGCRLVDLKNIYNLKVRVMFYLVGIFRTSRPADSISSNPERTAPRKGRREVRGQVI